MIIGRDLRKYFYPDGREPWDGYYKENLQRKITLRWIWALRLATQKFSTNQSVRIQCCVIYAKKFLHRIRTWFTLMVTGGGYAELKSRALIG